MANSGKVTFGRFAIDGVRSDSVQADYMIADGLIVKLYLNGDGKQTEDRLVAVVNTATGYAVIDVDAKV